MAQNEERLRRSQVGIELTRGTEVVPNWRLRDTIRLMDAREPLEFDEAAGTYDSWYTFEQGPVNVSGTWAGPLSFEDAPYQFLHGVTGAEVATGDSNVTNEAFTWDFVPDPDTDDLASSTIEHGAPDNVYVSTMMMVNQFTLRGDVDGDATWMWDAQVLARDLEARVAGFEPGISLHDREFVRAAGTKLYLDDTAGSIGTTLQTGKFINFSLTWNNNLDPKRFMEDIDAVSTTVGRGARQITGQIRLEFATNAEKAKYRSGSRRAIRIEQTGSTIHDAVKKRIRIDIPNARWLTPSDDPRVNNMTLTFGFRALVDTTLGYAARIEVVNDLEEYPTSVAA